MKDIYELDDGFIEEVIRKLATHDTIENIFISDYTTEEFYESRKQFYTNIFRKAKHEQDTCTGAVRIR